MIRVMLLLSCICLAGCANRVAITPGMVAKYNLTDKHLRNLQYYISDKIVIQRLQQNVSKNKGTGLQLVDSTFLEEVVVKPNTPGILEAIDKDTFIISFEEGSTFSFKCKDPDSSDSVFELQADRMRKDDEKKISNNGTYVFRYRGKDFYAKEIEDRHLLIDEAEIYSFEKETKVLPGRRVK